jgi:hypothetical protein
MNSGSLLAWPIICYHRLYYDDPGQVQTQGTTKRADPDDAPGLGPVLEGLGRDLQYKNDEQIDNQLRSVLFQIPVEGNPDCLDGPELPRCFNGVSDLGAIDVQRTLDHGMPSYNELRRAYGLPPVSSFTEITGEESAEFPPGLGIDDPASLEFLELFDIDGNPIDLDDEEAVDGDAVRWVRATPLAARLQAIFGSVDNLDPFTGMVSEQHVPGTDFGELQLAIWTREFQNLRDGDRFFYGTDPGLTKIRDRYGIDFRRTLAEVIGQALAQARIALPDLRLILPHNVNRYSWLRLCRRIGHPVDRVFLENVPVTGHCFCADPFLNYRSALDRGLLRPGDPYLMAAVGLGATFSAMVFEH